MRRENTLLPIFFCAFVLLHGVEVANGVRKLMFEIRNNKWGTLPCLFRGKINVNLRPCFPSLGAAHWQNGISLRVSDEMAFDCLAQICVFLTLDNIETEFCVFNDCRVNSAQRSIKLELSRKVPVIFQPASKKGTSFSRDSRSKPDQ